MTRSDWFTLHRMAKSVGSRFFFVISVYFIYIYIHTYIFYRQCMQFSLLFKMYINRSFKAFRESIIKELENMEAALSFDKVV